MRYLELLTQEHNARKLHLSSIERIQNVPPSIRYYDPDLVKINQILNTVCNYYDYRTEIIRSHNRNKRVSYVRNVVFFICVYLYGLPVVKVAKSVGKMDRTTITKGRDKIYVMMQNSQHVAADLRDIRGLL